MAAEQAQLREQRPDVLEALAATGSPTDGEQLPSSIAAGQRDEFEVTFLGTGAAVPSKYRNVTGIHVNLFGRGGLLMDCGALWQGHGWSSWGVERGSCHCNLPCDTQFR